jgi:hypothetical protein
MHATVLNLEGRSFQSIMVGELPGTLSSDCLLGRSFGSVEETFNAFLGCLV